MGAQGASWGRSDWSLPRAWLVPGRSDHRAIHGPTSHPDGYVLPGISFGPLSGLSRTGSAAHGRAAPAWSDPD